MPKSGTEDLIVEMTREQLQREIHLVNMQIAEHVSEIRWKREWISACTAMLAE